MSGLLRAVGASSIALLMATACAAPRTRGSGSSPVNPGTEDSGTTPTPGNDATVQPDNGSGPVLPTNGLLTRADRVHLYLNLGDSQAAGYNAPNRYGWAKLLYENQRWSDYDGHDLHTLFASAQMIDQAVSGWTSADVVNKLRTTINGLPAGGDGDDTVVTLSAGGNDFNDAMETMFVRSATESVARNLTANYDAIFQMLRDRYQDSSRGRELIVVATNVYDPTDGQVRIPSEFRDGFCETLSGPMINDSTAAAALGNLDYFNQQIAAVIESNGGTLADHYAIYMGHGMNSGDARWMDDDCTHPKDIGHHNQRRLIWQILTGELIGAPW